MDYSPHYSDSPRGSILYLPHPNEGPQETHAHEPSDNSERTNSDKLSALPGDVHSPGTSYRPGRGERGAVPTSRSAPSLHSSAAPRSFPASPESQDVRSLTSDGSLDQNSSHHRVSFDGNHASMPTPNHSPRANVVRVHPLLREAVSPSVRGIDSTMNRMTRSSDPTRPSSIMRAAGPSTSPKKPGQDSPVTGSAPHSRATSPIRLFNWSGFHRSREDPFIPIDPFQLRTRLRRFSFYSPDIESHLPLDPMCEENPFCCLGNLNCSPKDRFLTFFRDARYFMVDTLPRQIYLLLLLRLPSLYFSRIARVYEDAQLSKPDLERMIACYSSSRQQQQREHVARSSPIPPGTHYHPAPVLPFPDEWTTANVSPALVRFKHSWEAFIDSLLREWKTLNLVSALLHSAIIAMFQTPDMSNDPVVRTAALLSLTCALMSLSFGCVYIVRFGTMRSMYKATRWAEEAARTTTFILWNVWVLLAMPAVWLAWSMLFFIVAILAFVWRSGSTSDPVSPTPLSPSAAIGPRVAVSALFFIGLLYFAAIVKTLHNYGRVDEHDPFTNGRARRANILENDAREGDGGSRRERGRTYGREGDRGRDSTRGTRGREPMRRDATGPGGLSAITGLGLTGLDGFASPCSSDEMSREKHQIEASV